MDNDKILDPANGLTLRRTKDGFLVNDATGRQYFEREGKLISLMDPISGGNLIPQPDGKFYSTTSKKTFTYECAKEGDEPRFYPEYLPYSGMTHVKAKVVDGKLIGENGIEFPIKNGLVKTPTTEGLTSQKEIDDDIADFEKIAQITIDNSSALLKYKIEQQHYVGQCEVLENLRKTISDFLKDMPLDNVATIYEELLESLGTKFVKNPIIDGDREPQIEDYIPNPPEPEMPVQQLLDPRLKEKSELVVEKNIKYYEQEAAIEKLILATRAGVNELEFKGYGHLRSSPELSTDERIKSVHGMNKQKVEKYRSLLQTIVDKKGITLQEAIQQYGSRFESYGINIDAAPIPKEEGATLSVSDYIPDPKIPEFVPSSKEGLTEKGVEKIAREPEVASKYTKVKELYAKTIGRCVDLLKGKGQEERKE